MRLVSRKPPLLRRSGFRISAPWLMMKSLKPWRRSRFSPVQMGDARTGDQALPGFGVIDRQRIFEPERLHRRDGFGDLDRCAQIVFPVAVDHDVVIPADGLTAVLKALRDVDRAPSC